MLHGCVKYADPSHIRNHEYIFSSDKMLEEDKGIIAVHMLYAYTRIRFIASTAKVKEEQLEEAKKAGLQLVHEKELKLLMNLRRNKMKYDGDLNVCKTKMPNTSCCLFNLISNVSYLKHWGYFLV